MDAPATNGPVAEGTLPTDTSAAAEMLSDSEVVWQVDIGGGLVPFAVAANDVPEVTIYGDGRIFVAEELETPPWTVPPSARACFSWVSRSSMSELANR